MIPITKEIQPSIHLRILPTDRFKNGLLSVTCVLPQTQENNCLAPLMLSVLRRGTQKYPSLAELNRRLDYLYGTGIAIRSDVCGDWLMIGLTAELLDESYLPAGDSLLEGVLEVMEQTLFHPVLDADGLLQEKYVESEKLQQRDAVRSKKNNPRAFSSQRCKEQLFAGQPAGINLYGTEEQIMAVTPKQLTDYWKSWKETFTPDFFYIGNTDVKRLHSALSATFPHFGGIKISLPEQTRVAEKETAVRIDEEQPITQSHLFIGCSVGVTLTDRDFYSAMVCNEILGGSPVSKLFMQVREKHSLCYSCFSSYLSLKGAILIGCGLKGERRKQAEKEILKQLKEIQKGRFTADELNAAKFSLVNSYRQLEDNPEDLESFFSRRFLTDMPDTLSDSVEKIGLVTKQEVVEVAKKIVPQVIYFLRGTLEGKGEEEDDGSEI